jgi:hypothetical protein
MRLKRCYDEGKRMLENGGDLSEEGVKDMTINLFFASLEEDYILEEDEKEPAAEEHPF